MTNYEEDFKHSFISTNIDITMNNIDNSFAINNSFDILKKELMVSDKRGALYYINGMVKEDLLEKLQEYFLNIKSDEMPKDSEAFNKQKLPFIEVDLVKTKEEIEYSFFSGVAVLVIDGYTEAILIDVRTYPARSISEPSKYRVLRGARDGFVETLVENTALIRRRIRSADYRCEIMKAGKSSKTDIAICYMKSRADGKMLSEIKKKIESINVDALTLNQESLAECIFSGSYINPFPKFRYTERPDTTAA